MKNTYLLAMTERNIFNRKGFIVGRLIIEFGKNIATYFWRSEPSLSCLGDFIGFPRCPTLPLGVHGFGLKLHFYVIYV